MPPSGFGGEGFGVREVSDTVPDSKPRHDGLQRRVGCGGRRNRGRRLLFCSGLFQLAQDAVEPDAGDQLHDEIVQPVLFAGAEYLDDVGMVQPGGGSGLTAEPLDATGPQARRSGAGLERHVPAQG